LDSLFEEDEGAVTLLQVYKNMRALIDPYWWTVGSASLVQLILFLRWLYRRVRNDEMTRAFVEDMATNHLLHIYSLLEKLCEQKGIERAPLPPIRWVDWGGN
jgi:hypothetical protein